MTPTNPEDELSQLKKQVAVLRREMDELKQFIRYNPPGTGDDDKPEAAYITIRCAIFTLAHPANPNHTLIYIMGSRDKDASITIMGQDEKTKLMLQVDKDVPEVTVFGKPGQYAATLQVHNDEPELDLYGRNGKIGVLLKVVGEDERGQVGVCAAGKPRAVVQARPTGGGLSVVHDDGHARVAIVSEVASGEILVVTPDMKPGVKISSNGLDGGYITVNRANGHAGVILSNIATGGAVIINDTHGKIIASLPSIEPPDLPESLE
jgi:hypothetical protein